MILLAASLFFTNPSPLEMPRAQAYLVKEKGVYRLEDRFDKTDLWISRTVDGSWRDDYGREFLLATLANAVPPLEKDAPVTRAGYVAALSPIGKKDSAALFYAVDMLSPVAPTEEFTRPHQTPRGYKEVRYYQGTNESAIVCAYLPEKSECWSFAAWTLADGDDFGEMMKTFEDEFLAKERPDLDERRASEGKGRARKKGEMPDERELLRADARHSVALYDTWRVTDGDEFTVLDDIGSAHSFTVAVTNDLKRMRAAYAAAVPSPIDGSNVLCVARIFASRKEYLDALEANEHDDMEWSAAYWSPKRRELVAYLPPDGSEKLLETIRHEAFHQYLSYATSMISASPWFNEGYAQYFENGPKGPDFVDPADLDMTLAEQLPALMAMGYDEFYAGTDQERRLKYRLALTIAVFLEKGAPEVRFEPFKDVKRDYVDALIKTKDMRKATAAAFKTEDNMKLFVNEWAKYWKKQ